MPKYAKYHKDLITKKRNFEDVSTVIFNEECSIVVHNDMPKKLKDLKSFSISCFIGDIRFEIALADLGASINFMTFLSFCVIEFTSPHTK